MNPSKPVLLLTAFAFLGFAAYGLLRPHLAPWPAGYSLPVAAAPGELRAYYGDFELGFGLFLLAAAFRARYREPAHLAAACTLGFIAIGRGWWMLKGRGANEVLLLSAAAELAFAAANLWAFSRAKSLARNERER
jgi:hypothetical protein